MVEPAQARSALWDLMDYINNARQKFDNLVRRKKLSGLPSAHEIRAFLVSAEEIAREVVEELLD